MCILYATRINDLKKTFCTDIVDQLLILPWYNSNFESRRDSKGHQHTTLLVIIYHVSWYTCKYSFIFPSTNFLLMIDLHFNSFSQSISSSFVIFRMLTIFSSPVSPVSHTMITNFLKKHRIWIFWINWEQKSSRLKIKLRWFKFTKWTSRISNNDVGSRQGIRKIEKKRGVESKNFSIMRNLLIYTSHLQNILWRSWSSRIFQNAKFVSVKSNYLTKSQSLGL